MAKILFKDRSFNSIRSQSWNETDFENLIVHNAKDLFPRWIPVPFKAEVMGEDGEVKKPDLALIDPMYRMWCVVEVELAHHPIFTHVLPQVSAFCSGNYGEPHAQFLKRNDNSLDISRLVKMMLGNPPEVMVIVDSPTTGWAKHLQPLGAKLGVVEPFRGPNDEILFRINGDQLEVPGEILSRCSRGGLNLRRFWKVHSPASIPATPRDDGLLEIEAGGLPALWRRHEFPDSVWLSSESHGDALAGVSLADIVEGDDGRLRFITVAKER